MPGTQRWQCRVCVAVQMAPGPGPAPSCPFTRPCGQLSPCSAQGPSKQLVIGTAPKHCGNSRTHSCGSGLPAKGVSPRPPGWAQGRGRHLLSSEEQWGGAWQPLQPQVMLLVARGEGGVQCGCRAGAWRVCTAGWVEQRKAAGGLGAQVTQGFWGAPGAWGWQWTPEHQPPPPVLLVKAGRRAPCPSARGPAGQGCPASASETHSPARSVPASLRSSWSG